MDPNVSSTGLMGDDRQYRIGTLPNNCKDRVQLIEDVNQVKGHWLMMEELGERIRIRNLGPKVQLEYDEEDEAQLPCECVICMEPFVLPVVTMCRHYFCRPCAVLHNYKENGCFICGKSTLGRFRNAHKLRERIAADKKM
ncbi:hypothetical protein POM88_018999 [Heracleum sosnowskyi]|uniref:RING-type domain-containing protein n=1 Tax=Heracleum sosnowskyi TaxID=360622 RepID=A0AAD8IU08_9APIA|nr:hypothetical protein POM88_018999 [Heracleum sosnowskyi]